MNADHARMISALKRSGVFHSPSIESAFERVDRKDFVPSPYTSRAYEDTALPIGHEQTISQPFTVAFLLELLSVRQGDQVLDIGSGSGWQTALLAFLVGEAGHVYAFERIPDLARFGERHLTRYPDLVSRATFFPETAQDGAPDIAERCGGFERIIAAARVDRVPAAWREQLQPGGILVYPQNEAIIRERKLPNGTFHSEIFPGFVFVPFISE